MTKEVRCQLCGMLVYNNMMDCGHTDKEYRVKMKEMDESSVKEIERLKGIIERNKSAFEEMKKECEKAFETNKRINAESLKLLKERDEIIERIKDDILL